MQLDEVMLLVLAVFSSQSAPAHALGVLGGIAADEGRISASVAYALIAAISGPGPKMFITRVRL